MYDLLSGTGHRVSPAFGVLPLLGAEDTSRSDSLAMRTQIMFVEEVQGMNNMSHKVVMIT